MKRQNKKETLFYVLFWGLLFLAPLVDVYFHELQHMRQTTRTAPIINWHDVRHTWMLFGGLLLVFVVHNHLLAPLLIYRRRVTLYLSSTLAVLALFMVMRCVTSPPHPALPPAAFHSLDEAHKPPRPCDVDSLFLPSADSAQVMAHASPDDWPEMGGPAHAPHHWHVREHSIFRDGGFFRQHDLVVLIILFLLLGMNLGVKYYFKSENDERLFSELEKENLQQQLAYLKYQINPHFFMNTLNNIHALVDIDPDKAKYTIRELSHLMRYVLYEGAKETVSLHREVDFVKNYIALMGIRYDSGRVHIDTQVSPTLTDVQVPPMLFIAFVENAFKHGVSYRQQSFVTTRFAEADGMLIFTCTNSKVELADKKPGGVGLANARQRLQLIYGSRHQLNISETADQYSVELRIPITT